MKRAKQQKKVDKPADTALLHSFPGPRCEVEFKDGRKLNTLKTISWLRSVADEAEQDILRAVKNQKDIREIAHKLLTLSV